ncbi:MBL fold metallo-hydrolase [Massilia psychrophila]|uniref:MBL fold metallo-hydrolase n=1 Tax=Massilia psychrophila TaxID=1603353 RepID=UPI0019CA6E71|nr:MBL fold metallo-hydrolase [Massilia psychrophila]GGE72279.1 hypothetical protein GCM10008020_16190 [Massilia psychrophila]
MRGRQITQLLNSHEHSDHTGGNAAVVAAATGAKVIAHYKSGIASAVSTLVQAGDVIKEGKTVEGAPPTIRIARCRAAKHCEAGQMA